MAWLCRLAQGVLHLQTADPGDGTAQTHEDLPLQLVCPPEVMDDLSDGLARVGVAGIVRELVVDDFAAVAIITPSGPKIHAHNSGMYHV